MSTTSLALFIFGVCYLVIMTERIHKTIVALSGATLMIAFGVVTQDEAFYSHEYGVDYNVVFLLIGMMVIINIIRETGLFEVLAIWAAKRAKARPFRLMVLLALLTAVLSAMLDNVTTVLLMAPVTLSISKRLELNPISFLLCEALSSNIGGTATLVGDPPNIMVSSKAELGYLDFLSVLGPIAMVIMAVFLGTMWVLFGRNMTVAQHLREAVMALNPKDAVRDPGLLRRCLWALGGVNLGFAFHSFVHLEPATVALLGASTFMLLGHARGRSNETEEMKYLAEVEWKTIFFFIGLFILVGGLVKIGAIRYLAERLVNVTEGNMAGVTLAVLAGSAVLSAFVDNIPYVAAMNPLIVDLARSLHPDVSDYTALVHQPDIIPLWWALALGACLGGNGTIIGASANVVIVDIARKAGYHISFWQFFRLGFPVMIGSVAISAVYLWLLFLR
ncbi:MAG: ArsB/NhaD family transporter [Nitrospira sp.]|jgi:Na+/H+ antiporter NhaD/arsenite permease-like protein|nr:ArsB/NhaD family transporter [Nitrospira sp.]MDH4242877.1 ArsB/NhaD family transporter [Nitrospira sp.]MDH4357968.1 ArsB/NhaD family transporter [Nitrospira sp.]MDH5319717.1 ArsB/NhaD family transporter [Nitrospira sp.]